ncbi:MAG: hypothetical protein H6608_11190 [Flavobacteriales bacterium]|nr:hypothetical protein [Bacteroidota bacterium]MCB9241691.1 hypothetical protein [Flavobacteriales bacterium]
MSTYSETLRQKLHYVIESTLSEHWDPFSHETLSSPPHRHKLILNISKFIEGNHHHSDIGEHLHDHKEEHLYGHSFDCNCHFVAEQIRMNWNLVLNG